MPLLGAHVSIAGGFSRAIHRGTDLGCEAVQIFVKNASQWRGRPLDAGEAKAFRTAHSASAIGPLVAHASYLINLAATDPETLARSRGALADELDRCRALGVTGLVLHPGAHLGAGEEAGIERVAASLDAVLAGRRREAVRVLLENTAGQGTVLGHRLEHLAAIRERCAHRRRVGFALDTCHAFAAGYALHEEAGTAELLAAVDELLGWDAVGCFHLNDSQKPFASRRDRHANIGRGEIGAPAFARLLHQPQLAAMPMILETPAGDDQEGYRRDLELLRSL